jgi:cyclic pyranopterin phosphate synthase
MDGLTHLDDEGHARMVDVSDREVTVRTATATGLVVTTPDVLAAIGAGSVPKGDVAAVARVAGILGAKRTPDLVPLCHPIALHGVEVAVEVTESGVGITATVRTADRTGVEMEALTAVAVTGLTVIDMIKSLDPAAQITAIRLETKDGGRSGPWNRPGTP